MSEIISTHWAIAMPEFVLHAVADGPVIGHPENLPHGYALARVVFGIEAVAPEGPSTNMHATNKRV